MKKRSLKSPLFLLLLSVFAMQQVTAQEIPGILQEPGGDGLGGIILVVLLLLITLIAALYLFRKAAALRALMRKDEDNDKGEDQIDKIISRLKKKEIEHYLRRLRNKSEKENGHLSGPAAFIWFLFLSLLSGIPAHAQSNRPVSSLFTEGGVIITIILIITPVLVGILLMIVRIRKMTRRAKMRREMERAQAVRTHFEGSPEDVARALESQKQILEYEVPRNELSGHLPPADKIGVLKNIDDKANIRFIEEKRKALDRPQVDPALSRLVVWYIISATLWLLWGTSVGTYVGIKFLAPDADHISWLSFGRLRPVHTNAVFWGWSSMAMMGLAYYVVPRVSNVKVYSIKWGWWSLWLVNAAVFFGSLSLMAGINNSGGEYREYIWPIQALFGIAVILTLTNFLKTIARRKTREIYISNWYIVAALIFVIVITLVAYLPFWQQGLGETIAQGYYMHQGVGMWFMMLTLGLVYYFLPQQLNKPIYSYSLGVLAFWSQILFYTLIGTHHFIFSPIPWSIQTIAIVASAGMVIPVVAGTTNFLMTFHGSWHKLSGSYTLPFILLGTIFYFVGSMQGTAEAFRTTNLFWHFTDFTVAHSHLTMYGIIAFFLWGFIYAIIPRMTRKEPPQVTVGIHFWLAFLGLMFYTVPLMIGGTMRGVMWMDGKPFIESVSSMAPYWLWRAIGGSLMWISHLVFAYNIYKMIKPGESVNINEDEAGLIDDDEKQLVDIR